VYFQLLCNHIFDCYLWLVHEDEIPTPDLHWALLLKPVWGLLSIWSHGTRLCKWA